MTSASLSPTIYPVYCHELSPTIGKWCPLRATDVHRVQAVGMVLDGKPLYHFGNHPIKWVRITGVIVAVDVFYQRRVYTVDDSSGECIECTCETPPPSSKTLEALEGSNNQERKVQANNPNKPESSTTGQAPPAKVYMQIADDIDVGSVVKVKGLVTDFRGMKQIEMRSIVPMKGTQEEVRCWNQIVDFRKDILDKPWIVEPAMEEKMKRRSLRPRHRVRRTRLEGDQHQRGQGADTKGHSEAAGKRPSHDPYARMRKPEDGYRRSAEKAMCRSKQQKEESRKGLKAANKVNYPSLAVRERVAGKYDALGI
ncbi:hypothetical protein BP6252_00845 [Coleophoma cylindrospora]|uniref:CST complex subunit STN1 n=1 Tax=Coleophoma cylindrospora TaxID=1849047 RepID=A0A3D8SR74_9HELO|nr:hypothetical protein BP6252_00845 [Coleophoma cylindrospora]